MKVDSNLFKVLDILDKNGYEAYLVGGAVRNYLLNRPIEDYDITTNADPNAIKMLFSDYTIYDIGKKHGTVAVIIDKITYEITPFRKESDYLDHRHPEIVEFSSELKDDLKRRDFTFNALCMNKDGEIIDYFNGIEDLNNKLIRAIGNPYTRFSEDALRILRALRFKAKLNFDIEENTREQLFKCKDLLSYISKERKREELLQILSCPNAFSIINEYLDIFKTFMPFDKVDRENNFNNPLFALAYLIKDVEDINLKKLKYSNDEIDLIKLLIASSKMDINDDYSFICILSNSYRKQILDYMCSYYGLDFTERFNKLSKYMIELNDLDITGEEIKEYGFTNEEIGEVKKQLLDAIHRQIISNDKSSLHKHIKENIL